MFKYSAITEKIKLSSDSWLPKNSVSYLLLIKCNILKNATRPHPLNQCERLDQHGAGRNNS